MPKVSRRVAAKNTSSGRGRKNRKKRQTTRHITPPVPKRISGQESLSSTRPTSNVRQVTPQPHVFSDLKRIGIIAVAMIVILIILYIVL